MEESKSTLEHPGVEETKKTVEEALASTLSKILTIRVLREEVHIRDGATFKPYTFRSSPFDPVVLWETDAQVAAYQAMVETSRERGGEHHMRLHRRPMRLPVAEPFLVPALKGNPGSPGDYASVFIIHDSPKEVFPTCSLRHSFGATFTEEGTVEVAPLSGAKAVPLGARLGHLVWVKPDGKAGHPHGEEALMKWRLSQVLSGKE